MGGKAGQVSRRYLFLGDYVDRGANSLECILTLLLNKLAYPKMFNLLRGNHELTPINRVYGFHQELIDRFNTENGTLLWKSFDELFSFLPLAAFLIGFLIGGWKNAVMEKTKKFDILINLHVIFYGLIQQIDLKGYIPNVVRGVSVFFGEDAVVSVCEKLKVDLTVRAHQMMLNGYGFFCKRKLLTVFSEMTDEIPSDAQKLIQECMEENATKRPSMIEVWRRLRAINEPATKSLIQKTAKTQQL
uniref:Serine/threonine-protein phosphatase n=1 Tax=Panagrolaimus davidi TaxID=227884 RepID=A0A914PWA2_9BILA